jgi:hypothetical protein
MCSRCFKRWASISTRQGEMKDEIFQNQIWYSASTVICIWYVEIFLYSKYPTGDGVGCCFVFLW